MGTAASLRFSFNSKNFCKSTVVKRNFFSERIRRLRKCFRLHLLILTLASLNMYRPGLSLDIKEEAIVSRAKDR